jgi:hypothetical protein
MVRGVCMVKAKNREHELKLGGALAVHGVEHNNISAACTLIIGHR